MFELLKNEFCGGSLQGYVSISPALLVKIFGKPEDSDEYKVSGEYCFRHVDSGKTYTLYDWKCTSLYYSSYPSPKKFWAQTEKYEFHIGGGDDEHVKELINALETLDTRILEQIMLLEDKSETIKF